MEYPRFPLRDLRCPQHEHCPSSQPSLWQRAFTAELAETSRAVSAVTYMYLCNRTHNCLCGVYVLYVILQLGFVFLSFLWFYEIWSCRHKSIGLIPSLCLLYEHFTDVLLHQGTGSCLFYPKALSSHHLRPKFLTQPPIITTVPQFHPENLETSFYVCKIF